jgi:hypothetical protein
MTTYTPKTKQAPADTAALPRDLAAALTTAEEALRDHDRIRSVLTRSHDAIPAALRVRAELQDQLAEAELNGKDTKVLRERRLVTESERLSFVGQRQGAIQALLDGETGLTERRDVLVAEKDQYAAGAVAEFRVKYDAAVLALQTAWATGDELARAMRFPVEMPLPVKVSGGRRETVSATAIPECDPIKVERVPGTDLQPVTIDPVAQRVGSALDKLDGALNFAAGIRSALHLETQLSMRASSRGFDPSPSAIYTVVEPFISHFDNLEFRPGTLIDTSLVPLVSLQRLVGTKKLRLATQATERVAA